jgi:aminopeptidase N, Escherichia coli type
MSHTITRHRLDYRPPAFLVPRLEMIFDLDAQATKVTSTLHFERNPNANAAQDFVLNGEKQTLLEVRLNDVLLTPEQYQLTDVQLRILNVGERGTITVKTRHVPADNTELEGLYLSSGVFCTQCEAEGFRRITYFPDRPDVLTRFTVMIRGDRKTQPVMLSNGNLIEQGVLDDERHFATWNDPFPKPCYLFALVAGDLDVLRDQFVTCSGRHVDLEIYSTKENIPRCTYAMNALKRAMRWDEERYGREYDLNRFMIFCADDFNMGAMENKGLNVFNSALVLADPETATDDDYHSIESVIAHEYFHNWTGDRITCRDWFQLSLKEGLTVFRDQQFSSDMGSAASERIQMVDFLRRRQFPEDAGPTAHPVRPDEYQEINNFYTTTVYEKGAEVIRMQHTLLGEDGFQRGMGLYFERHDGQAVTCDDFVQAMQDASGVDLTQFKRWYAQAGTPEIRARAEYQHDTQEYRLTLAQHTSPTPGQPVKKELVIPVGFALLDQEGKHVALRQNNDEDAPENRVLVLHEQEQTFVFRDVPPNVVPSLLRDGSAPARLLFDYSKNDLQRLARFDTDPVNRWDAMQRCFVQELANLAQVASEQKTLKVSENFLALYVALLNDEKSDPMLRALALSCPDLAALVDDYAPFDCNAFINARQFLLKTLADRLQNELQTIFNQQRECTANTPYAPVIEQQAHRRLAAHALSVACANDNASSLALAENLYQHANNMTDTIAALSAIRDSSDPLRGDLYADFAQRWRHHPLVLDKWFTLEATRNNDDTLTRVKTLTEHPMFTLKNPNRVRALLGAFALRNFPIFHREDGQGYRLVAHYIDVLDASNPHSASTLLNAFRSWKKWSVPQRNQAFMLLQELRQKERSPEVNELLDKMLAE